MRDGVSRRCDHFWGRRGDQGYDGFNEGVMAVDRTLYARISSALQTGQPTRVIDDNCTNLVAVEGTRFNKI